MSTLTIPSTIPHADGYKARVILDSVAPHGGRLTTIEATFPRFVLAEFNTHRQFSRNSASSRAIPTAKMIERVREHPVVPIKWPANQSGMQGGSELTGEALEAAQRLWNGARCAALDEIDIYLDLCKDDDLPIVHKQIINRLLEPFLWHTVVVSSTEWSNFWALRCHPDADPHIEYVAQLMRAAYNASTPMPLDYDDWHTPFILEEERKMLPLDERKKISVARCARVSYLTHDGTRDLEKDLFLHDRLIERDPLHASPAEHVATPSLENTYSRYTGNFKGWTQYRKLLPNECR